MFQDFNKNLKPAVPQVLEESGFEPVMKHLISVFEESYSNKEKEAYAMRS